VAINALAALPFRTVAVARPVTHYPVPSYVENWIFAFGFSDALRRVQFQRDHADTTAAHDYYVAVLSAMSAILSNAVPGVTPMGAATDQRIYPQPQRLALSAQGTVS
jgi:hypothetical protein